MKLILTSEPLLALFAPTEPIETADAIAQARANVCEEHPTAIIVNAYEMDTGMVGVLYILPEDGKRTTIAITPAEVQKGISDGTEKKPDQWEKTKGC